MQLIVARWEMVNVLVPAILRSYLCSLDSPEDWRDCLGSCGEQTELPCRAVTKMCCAEGSAMLRLGPSPVVRDFFCCGGNSVSICFALIQDMPVGIIEDG